MSETRCVAIVMSRMPRLVQHADAWLAGLRACLRRIQQRAETLLIIPGTAGSDFIRRGAERLAIEVRLLSDLTSLERSARDQQLIDQADEVFVLGLRKDGNIHRLLTARLESGRRGIYLVDHAGLQSEIVQQQLIAAGAEVWGPSSIEMDPLTPLDAPTIEINRSEGPSPSRIVSISSPQHSSELFLTHTTRACPGPWPQQAVAEYLDRLLDSRREGDHSALLTLSRIIEQRRLIASNRTIRGSYPVVSFTAVALAELPQLRRFRTHRSRWDFEPYGLCIRRSALERLGVRPVQYGADETWKTLSEADRPYFQLSCESPSETEQETIDWSVEQEWRHPGDLDLTLLNVDDVLVFVSSYAEARTLQPHCPWPVTLWPGEIE